MSGFGSSCQCFERSTGKYDCIEFCGEDVFVSLANLINVLEKQLIIHEQLYNLAVKKTDLLKKDDVNQLMQLLKEEQKYVMQLENAEKERIKAAACFLEREDDLTISACIEKAENEDKERLINLKEKLTNVLANLKNANFVNQQLALQALQVVNLTLDLFMPEEASPNYTNSNQESKQSKRRSWFDSKI
ncbi:flagellar protein FlgN [Aeribacillus pallidus]|nr:flagellar protein FlgN [Aeribacillus pallidus]